jgi:hypothetical protein
VFIPLVHANTPEAAQDTARREIALADLETAAPGIEISERFFDFGELKDGYITFRLLLSGIFLPMRCGGKKE